jgi:iron complex transport system substrate-binding protein
LLKLPVGLLINFGGATLKEGLRRIVNDLDASLSPLLHVNQPQAPRARARDADLYDEKLLS